MSTGPTPIGRRAVIRAGASAGLIALLAGCSALDGDAEDEAGADAGTGDTLDRVVVVGAGAAGLSTAAFLVRSGVSVEVLEATATHGGRMRHTRDFVDFPIPLGAEWLHEAPSELDEVTGDDGASDEIELARYLPTDEVAYFDGTRVDFPMGDDPDGDLKFVGSSWLDVFERYVLPDVADSIEYGVDVVRVEELDDGVRVITADGDVREADAVVVTVPIALLRDRHVTFEPPLPATHLEAIDGARIWGGIKVFLEFTERFYPAFTAFPDSDTPDGQRLYYDAAHGQRSDANVLGLFAVGEPAERYQALDPGDALRDAVLAELDDIYDGAASTSYVRHLVQDWTDEPYARAAYLADSADWRTPAQLSERFSERVLLAGDAYTSHDDWSAVDDAARSGRDAAQDLLS